MLSNPNIYYIIQQLVNMLAKIAPRFVISRVIQNSYLAENQALSLVKKRFEDRSEYYASVDGQNYQLVKFYGYISTLTKPDGFKNKYEERAYEQACQRFKTFNETLEIYDRLESLHSEARMIYNYLERNVAASNFFTQRIETDKDFESDIVESVQKYNTLEDALAPYPEWLEKVQQQIGGLYHLIYNNLGESEAKRKVFSKLRRQQHFL